MEIRSPDPGFDQKGQFTLMSQLSQSFGSYQDEIYAGGLRGVVPSYPMTYPGWEAGAQAALPPSVWSYVTGGAGNEYT